MITKRLSATAGHVCVRFELPSCIWADHIYLIGEFNQWTPGTMPMQQGRDGVWRIELELPFGHTYQFRYLIDGHWLTDSHADGATTNEYGTQNSIVDTTMTAALLKMGEEPLYDESLWWHNHDHQVQLGGGNV